MVDGFLSSIIFFIFNLFSLANFYIARFYFSFTYKKCNENITGMILILELITVLVQRYVKKEDEIMEIERLFVLNTQRLIGGKDPVASEELTRSRLVEDIQHKISAMGIGV